MADIDELIEKHGEATVRQAFWLQEKIYKEGIEAVRFTDVAETEMKRQGPRAVKRQIESNTTKDF